MTYPLSLPLQLNCSNCQWRSPLNHTANASTEACPICNDGQLKQVSAHMLDWLFEQWSHAQEATEASESPQPQLTVAA